MSFCPICSYAFDISKSSDLKDDRTVISKVVDVLKMIEEKDDLSTYKASFPREEMIKNKKYLKLPDETKKKIELIFDESLTSGAEFRCNNCNFSKKITETTLLYQIKIDDKVIKIKNVDENELLYNDPLMPHTKDYTCKNPSCISHKKSELKDSIFYRDDNNNYKINYICGVCFFSW